MVHFSKLTRVRIRRGHRWLGLVVGVQLSFWMISGVYFAWIPFQRVQGKDQTARPQKYLLSSTNHFLSPQEILQKYGSSFSIAEVRLSQEAQNPTYLIFNEDHHPVLRIHAETGAPLSPITSQQAVAAAAQDFGDQFKLRHVQYIEKNPPEDYRGALPIFQVAVDDSRHTNLYVNPVEGRVVARRNSYWRWYDRLWMLHILDFKEREDFNNPILRIVVLGGFALVVSGYILFWTSRPFKQKKS